MVFADSSMKNLPSLSRHARQAALGATFLAVVLGGWVLAPAVHSQAPPATTSNAALVPLLAKLKAQQDQLAANQTKIEAQTAQLKEEIRQTKIFAARSGTRR